MTIYERTLEGIICLFIPFYDEVKFLFLLFLILTRARVSLSSLLCAKYNHCN